MPLSVAEFVNRWRINALSESSGAQSHFNNLCEMLGEPTPAESDSVGERFTFEKPVSKVYGGKGFADVWMRDHFAWEYKGPHKNLDAAYKQLNDYREDLGNPPLLVVCDLNIFRIHTNFTNTDKRIYSFDLRDLERNTITPNCPLPPLEVLRALFGDYNVLRPNRTDALVTREVAKRFSRLAERLEIEKRAHTESPIHTKEEIAHFLMRILFCLFADSVGLLPNNVFRRLISDGYNVSLMGFQRRLKALFEAMSEKDSIFGEHDIKYFNGGLFDSSSTIILDKADLGILHEASKNYNWAHVAPEIFGTLFERSLNPQRRSLIGAHYTSAEDILLLIDPVIMRPLEARWENVRAAAELEITKETAATAATGDGKPQRALRLKQRESERILADWFSELTSVRVLDPACGSGNFLYLALKRLLDLYQKAADFVAQNNLSPALPKMPSPEQLYGIEIEFLAHELASVVVWIGFLQWRHQHGDPIVEEPILKRLPNIEHNDAILRYDAEGKPHEPEWPEADYIVGNPPFLGDKKMRRELDTVEHPRYVDDVRKLYAGRVPGGADLVTFWFEKARAQIELGATERVGLLATNSISMIGNRPVLERIKETGDIFMAWSDRPWLLNGAAVRVAMLGFDDGSEDCRTLDGEEVQVIHADLTAGSNVAGAIRLRENQGLCFLGIMKGGPFDITAEEARKMLSRPVNPNGRPNSDVVKRRLGGQDISGRDRQGWIIDFLDLSEKAASLYEMPFEYIKQKVKPKRDENRDALMNRKWWLHGRSRPALRTAIENLSRCIVTPEVNKYRLFAWMDTSVIPDHKVHVVVRADDYFFGLLQSRVHESWTIATCSWIGKGNDPSYNSATTFETFPFPWPPGKEPTEAVDPRVKAIADAARELVRLRDAWLNPPGASESDVKDRTLTKLYNQRPEWLANAHRTLDEAVFSAYGWPSTLTDQEILSRLLGLNHERAAAQTA